MSKELSEMTIPELVAHLDATQGFVEAAVMRARRDTKSWSAIGAELGVSAQEAHRRYSQKWKYYAAAEGLPTGA